MFLFAVTILTKVAMPVPTDSPDSGGAATALAGVLAQLLDHTLPLFACVREERGRRRGIAPSERRGCLAHFNRCCRVIVLASLAVLSAFVMGVIFLFALVL